MTAAVSFETGYRVGFAAGWDIGYGLPTSR